MTVHAFADESRYVVAVAIAEPSRLRQLRRALRELLLPGQREIHFAKEKEARRRLLTTRIARLPVQVRVYHHGCGRQEEPARQACVERLTTDLHDRGAHRLVLDSRSHRDIHDARTIRRALGRRARESHFVYEHLESTSEPMLWTADAVAWCFDRGGQWRSKVADLITAVIDVDGSS